MAYVVDFIVIGLVYYKLVYTKKDSCSRTVFQLTTAYWIYCALLIAATLMPVVFNLPHLFDHAYRMMNLNPFVDVVEGHLNAVQEVLFNIIIVIPMGLFQYFLKKRSLLKSVCVCFLASLFIELFQPLISSIRISDITDIMTNTFGGLLGWLLASILDSDPAVKETRCRR